MTTAVIRSPWRTSPATSRGRSACAALHIRVNRAVTSDTVTSECGSMNTRKA